MRKHDSAGMTFDPLCDPTLLLDQAVWQQTQDLLSHLGERLCCGSATLALSEALRLPDYTTAADEFSVMAGKIMDYSPDTRLLLSAQFLETSVQFQQIDQSGFSAHVCQRGVCLAGWHSGGDGRAVGWAFCADATSSPCSRAASRLPIGSRVGNCCLPLRILTPPTCR